MIRLIISAFFFSVMMFSWSKEINCDTFSRDYNAKYAEMSHKGCPKECTDDIYIETIVQDSILMDKIIASIENIYATDSLYYLIKNEYFNAWFREEEIKYIQIDIRCKEGLRCCPTDSIKEKFLPQGFNLNIIDKKLIWIGVDISYHLPPFGGYHTVYKGKDYFFINTYLARPTSEKFIIRECDPDAMKHIYNFMVINFFEYEGKLYLDPTEESWKCYQ